MTRRRQLDDAGQIQATADLLRSRWPGTRPGWLDEVIDQLAMIARVLRREAGSDEQA